MKYIKSVIHDLFLGRHYPDNSTPAVSRRVDGNSKGNNLTFIVLTLIFILFAFFSYFGSNARLLGPPFNAINGQDFRQILRASGEILKGENIYQHAIPYAQSPDFSEFKSWTAAPYPYSPIVAVLAIPLLQFDENSVLVFWTTMSWIFLIGAGIVIVIGVFENRSIFGLLAILVFFVIYGPVHLNLNLVQLDICIFFLVSLGFYLYKRDSFYAGIVLGLAVSLKLLVAPMIVYFLWKREWKIVILSLSTTLFLIVAGFYIVGWDQFPDFLKVNYLWSTTDMLAYPFNQSLNGLGIRFFTNNSYIAPLINLPVLAHVLRFTGMSLAVFLWSMTVSRKDNRHNQIGFLEYGFTLSTMLFLSPLVDDIHYVWILLPVSGLLMVIKLDKSDWRRSLLSVVALLGALYLAHPDLHDAIYYGWENLVYNNVLVDQRSVFLTGAYVYGLAGLEICLLFVIFHLRRKSALDDTLVHHISSVGKE